MKRIELIMKTLDLIASDRTGTRRDDGRHTIMSRRYENAISDYSKLLDRINKMRVT